MQQTLLIDRGNSRFKWQLMDDSTVIAQGVQQNNTPFTQALAGLAISTLHSVWASNVSDDSFESALSDWLVSEGLAQERIHFVKSEQQAHGVINGYQQPEKLGVDRWLAMIGAKAKYSGLLCVVDCGTASTLDVVAGNGQHLGGYIIPGLSLMSQSLQENTAKIQLNEMSSSGFLGKNTAEAVSLGAQKSLLGLIRQTVLELSQRYELPVQLVMTGGAGVEVHQQLELSSSYIADLVIRGLSQYAGLKI